MAPKFVIRLTHGTADAERAITALTVAATAVASGIATELWLMNDAVELALPGVVEDLRVEHAPPANDLWQQILGGGGAIYACTPCLMRRSLNGDHLREGVTQGGAAGLVASVADGDVRELSF